MTKKISLIKSDKIATVNNSVLHKKLGILPSDLFNQVEVALKKSLNIIGLTQDSWNNEPLQAQRSRRNEDLREILRKSCIT